MSGRLTLEALEALDAIDRMGTFAAAAESLYRVPSALTYTIRKLEDDLGVTLFARQGRKAVFTETGRFLLEQGRLILKATRDLEERTRQIESGWESRLRIALDALFPAESLFDLINEFKALDTGVDIELSMESLAGSWEAIRDDRADLVVGATGEASLKQGLGSQPYKTVDFVFVATPGHPLTEIKSPLESSDIEPYLSVAVRDTALSMAPRSTGILAKQRVLRVSSMEDKLQAHVSGLGVGFLPYHRAEPYIQRGQLVALTLVENKPPVETFLLWRNEKKGRGLNWFINHLSSQKPEDCG